MDTTRAEQIALDDALVAPAKRLNISKSNLRLSSDLKSKEATLQVVYDVLKLTPFYKAFQITVDVPKIYMQEQMLQICPKLLDQQFEELPFEEEILTFLRDIGHSGEIKVITDVNVNKLHQPWRSFVVVINKCLSDYAYLLWEDFVYQVENKNVKRSNEMYYPRFTKVIINFFMTKDQSIPRRNKVNWHFVRDDPMFTMIKVVSRHENTQLYGAFLPIYLTNEAIKDLESYKEYYVIASGAEPPKTKASVKKKQFKSDKAKTPPATKGKILKTTSKVTKPSMKKQPTQGLETLSEVALTEEEQMRIVTKRSLTEGTGVTPWVPDVPKYGFDDEQSSWKSSSDEDNDVESKNDDDNDELLIIKAMIEGIILRDEAQAENADFINKLDDNIKKIIKDQVKEQVKAQVSKILPKIEKTVNEQLEAESTQIVKQKNLYKALVDAYESNKLILDTYGETVSFKRLRDKEDKDEEPSAGSNRGVKFIHKTVCDESAQAEEPMQTAKDLEESAHQEFEIGVTKDQPNEETSQLPDWFQKLAKPPTLDHDWNKTLSDAHGPIQPWLSSLAQIEGPRESFNELLDTPLERSQHFVDEPLKVDNLTPEILARSNNLDLMKGSCKRFWWNLNYYLVFGVYAIDGSSWSVSPLGKQGSC
ncbi:hypothetical protein Tco_0735524 [Tanacetum coccineum]